MSVIKSSVILITCIFLSSFLLFSCASPKYLPSYKKINTSYFGSHIYIYKKKGTNIKGELLAVDSNSLAVLVYKEFKPTKVIVVPKNDIRSYTLKYARPLQYGWMVPILVVATIYWHELFAILTAPLNILYMAFVVNSANGEFSYNSKTISYEHLKMFARFPQGIPPGINIDSIK